MYMCKHFIKSLRLNNIIISRTRYFSQTSKLYSFFEKDNRGAEYPIFVDQPWQEFVKESGPAFINECKLLWEETKERFRQDNKYYNHGDTDVFWRFDSEECLKQWRIGSDKMNNEGQSEGSLIINNNKKGVFSGNIDMTPPKDGKKRFSGYCGIKSVRKRKSFFRDAAYPFGQFTHLELRVRGDGRNYGIHLGILGYYDVTWFQMYTYAIYTHGGPYWQTIRIPFSKFFQTSKGRIQDDQYPVPLDSVNCIGILCSGVAGPFRLEIDYIGCHLDRRHREKFAYELYKIPKEFVST